MKKFSVVMDGYENCCCNICFRVGKVAKIKYYIGDSKCRAHINLEFPSIGCCTEWQPIPCPRCGGALSETRIYHYSGGPIAKSRKYDGKPYRHCYACHSEFFVDEKPSV